MGGGKSPKRLPAVAGPHRFYPDEGALCRRTIEGLIAPEFGANPEPLDPVAAIVPHAGWAYSGRTALAVLTNVNRKARPSTFVFFGFSHRGGPDHAALYPGGAWQSPLGDAVVDERLVEQIAKRLGEEATVDPRAHEHEHSIEVQIPLVQFFWPDAKIVPILVPAGPRAHRVGALVGEVVSASGRGDVFAIGTTDLTHYGHSYGFAPKGTGSAALAWVKEENDDAMIRAIVQMRVEEIEREARTHRNACGPSAVAATVAYAKARGASRGVLIDYATSHDAMPGGEPSTFVGYAGILF